MATSAAHPHDPPVELDRLLELPFDNLVGAHDQPLFGGARDALRATVDRVFG